MTLWHDSATSQTTVLTLRPQHTTAADVRNMPRTWTTWMLLSFHHRKKENKNWPLIWARFLSFFWQICWTSLQPPTMERGVHFTACWRIHLAWHHCRGESSGANSGQSCLPLTCTITAAVLLHTTQWVTAEPVWFSQYVGSETSMYTCTVLFSVCQ